jgi:hypothetical protein
VLQELRAERYPSIRWHFPWQGYVVVTEPDDLTPGFAYEFKTSRSRYTGAHLLPVALAQADLYASFWGRPAKRVQLLVVEEDSTDTWESPADRQAAEAVLEEFRAVDAGARTRPPRERWKCQRCDVRADCPICPLGPG